MLFTLPPLRLPIPDGAHTGTAAVCWWSRERWLTHVEALYDTHYRTLRAAGLIPSVAKQTFMTVMDVMAADADYDTGRGCRTPVGDTRADGTRTGLCAHTKRVRRTVQRAREIARHLHVVTEILPGRHRTLAERLESWKRGDKARGWCAVHTLHETTRTDLPVDNSTRPDLQVDQNVTPLRSGNFFFSISSKSVVTTATNMQGRRAPRGPAMKRQGKRASAFDPKALLLASRCAAHPSMPSWVRRHGAKSWAAVLTKPAQHGWDVDDVIAAIDDYTISRRLLTNPANPFGYLAAILAGCDLTAPPAAHLKAQVAEEDARRRAEQERIRAEIRRRDANAAGPDSPGRRAALAAARAAHTRTDRTSP